ncbi:MAG: isochorismatase family protein [Rhizobacter sp.]|nr:isochorismatase family protein [Ferruginibacter sp.]
MEQLNNLNLNEMKQATVKIMSALLVVALLFTSNTHAQTKRTSDYLGTITKDNAAVLLIDHQTNLILGSLSMESRLLVNNTLALANIAKIFKLPVVLTSTGGGANGPAGPIIPELLAEFPGQKVIDRQMYFNAMNDPVFKADVEKTKRKKLIIAGITTDLCVMFPAITAVAEGYDVYIVVDACASWDSRIDTYAFNRLSQAGCILTNINALMAELQNNLAVSDPDAAKANQKNLLSFYGRFVGPLSLMNGTFFKGSMPK